MNWKGITLDHGAVTLPTEVGKEKETRAILKRWGADAVRNSDGTELPSSVKDLNCKVVSTVCLVRADQAFARKNMNTAHQHALMSEPVTAMGSRVVIDPLAGYFRGQHEINWDDSPRKWWQVFDRTEGRLVPPTQWNVDRKKETVTITRAQKGHSYTVNFWAYQVWDPTSMFNHILNHWTKPRQIAVDPMYPKVRRHFLDYIERWIRENPATDVVRLTSLFYHFTLFHSADGKGAWLGWRDRYRDTYGYMDCCSPRAFGEFEKATGVRLTLEDIVDQGYYNYPTRPISARYRAWVDFIHKFVINLTREINARIHRRGRESMVFLGDHWIGLEPYMPDFPRSGLDIVVGACETGVQARHTTDIPHRVVKELRLGPYFFDACFENGVEASLAASHGVWTRVRRAIMRQPTGRIGWGGYLHVPLRYPKYVNHITQITREFRELLIRTKGTLSRKVPGKVAVLNYWGKMRSWQLGPIGYERFGQISYLEILAGLPFDIEFISFDDVIARGIPKDVSVIINGGRARTNWSGGEYWRDARLVAAVQNWIAAGGGFIGIDEPAAVEHGGRFFQLSDALGVEKELGFTVEKNTPTTFELVRDHFIATSCGRAFAPENVESFVYPCSPSVKVLAARGDHVLMAVNNYAKGRTAYLARASFDWEQTRLLHNTILWVGRHEGETRKGYSTNHLVECACYPATRNLLVVNNSDKAQSTNVFDLKGKPHRVRLKPFASEWIKL